jgi:hypothetical protein
MKTSHNRNTGKCATALGIGCILFFASMGGSCAGKQAAPVGAPAPAPASPPSHARSDDLEDVVVGKWAFDREGAKIVEPEMMGMMPPELMEIFTPVRLEFTRDAFVLSWFGDTSDDRYHVISKTTDALTIGTGDSDKTVLTLRFRDKDHLLVSLPQVKEVLPFKRATSSEQH